MRCVLSNICSNVFPVRGSPARIVRRTEPPTVDVDGAGGRRRPGSEVPGCGEPACIDRIGRHWSEVSTQRKEYDTCCWNTAAGDRSCPNPRTSLHRPYSAEPSSLAKAAECSMAPC